MPASSQRTPIPGNWLPPHQNQFSSCESLQPTSAIGKKIVFLLVRAILTFWDKLVRGAIRWGLLVVPDSGWIGCAANRGTRSMNKPAWARGRSVRSIPGFRNSTNETYVQVKRRFDDAETSAIGSRALSHQY